MITRADEALLTWYFGYGQTAFERSPLGGMLERAEFYSHIERRCRRCIDGVREDGRDCRKCNGTGYRMGIKAGLDHQSYRSRTGYVRCFVCKGASFDDGRVCDSCEGRLYHVTDCRAFIDIAPPNGRGYMPDDFQLTAFARVSRRLIRIPNHTEVLKCFYGDLGSRWGRTRQGRIFALYHLTKSGAKFARKKAGNLSPSETLGVQMTLERTQPKRERRVILDACERQARELYRASVRAWNSTKTTEPQPSWEQQWDEMKTHLATRPHPTI